MDEELADVALVPVGWELVQQLVGELTAFGRQLSEELGVRAVLDPLNGAER
ncbi:hypothetical protein [Streptomyces sp. NPDC017673]|uniref:hypothetical protein n=1 Tax=unclassified Streptomyces TaxID=2593676 RepID=UPI0037B076FD